mgnify:CR=1 FL=1
MHSKYYKKNSHNKCSHKGINWCVLGFNAQNRDIWSASEKARDGKSSEVVWHSFLKSIQNRVNDQLCPWDSDGCFSVDLENPIYYQNSDEAFSEYRLRKRDEWVDSRRRSHVPLLFALQLWWSYNTSPLLYRIDIFSHWYRQQPDVCHYCAIYMCSERPGNRER